MKKMLAILVIIVFAIYPVLGDDIAEWDNTLQVYGFERVAASSVPSELRASASLLPDSLEEIVTLLESRPSATMVLQQDSGALSLSSNRTYECSRTVGGLGHGWFRHYVDGVIDRRHGKEIFASVSNNRWAHTGFTLGTKATNVSINSSISSDRRRLTMRSSWVVSAAIPTPWGDFYFHSESVSNSCSKSP